MARGKTVSINQSQVNAALAAGLKSIAPVGTYRPLGGTKREYENIETGQRVPRRAIQNASEQITFDRKAKERERIGIPKGPGRGRKGQKTGIRAEYTPPRMKYTQPFIYIVQIERKDGSFAYVTVLSEEVMTKKEILTQARLDFLDAMESRAYQGLNIKKMTIVGVHRMDLYQEPKR